MLFVWMEGSCFDISVGNATGLARFGADIVRTPIVLRGEATLDGQARASIFSHDCFSDFIWQKPGPRFKQHLYNYVARNVLLHDILQTLSISLFSI